MYIQCIDVYITVWNLYYSQIEPGTEEMDLNIYPEPDGFNKAFFDKSRIYRRTRGQGHYKEIKNKQEHITREEMRLQMHKKTVEQIVKQ